MRACAGAGVHARLRVRRADRDGDENGHRLGYEQALMDNGIFGLVRPPLLHTAPPLVISEAELRDGLTWPHRQV